MRLVDIYCFVGENEHVGDNLIRLMSSDRRFWKINHVSEFETFVFESSRFVDMWRTISLFLAVVADGRKRWIFHLIYVSRLSPHISLAFFCILRHFVVKRYLWQYPSTQQPQSVRLHSNAAITNQPTALRKRNMKFFIIPFGKNVKTNVVRRFLNLIVRHFKLFKNTISESWQRER